MHKKILISALVFIMILTSLVTASLYAEKVPDPSRFTSIQPRWSAQLELSDGQTIKVSLITFKWLSYQNKTEVTHMFYLNDGMDEYLAEKGAEFFVEKYEFTCQEGYENCTKKCDSGDESCIDDCVEEFNCGSVSTCSIFAPDDTCSVERIEQNFGKHTLSLNFDPNSGKPIMGPIVSDSGVIIKSASNYDGKPIELVAGQNGFLSKGVFSLE